MIGDQIRFHRLKGANPNVEGNEFVRQLLEQFLGKMQTCSWCGHGSGGRGENSLVSFGIGSVGFTLDVRRQRHFAALFQIQRFGKPNFTVAIFKNSGDLTAELRFDKLAAYGKPRSGADQATPRAIIGLPKEEDFCIPILESDPSRHHSGVIQDQQLLWRDKIDEFAKMMVGYLPVPPVDQHQLGITTGWRWPKRDQLFGKIVVVIFCPKAHVMLIGS
jgi:hypothetical protein